MHEDGIDVKEKNKTLNNSFEFGFKKIMKKTSFDDEEVCTKNVCRAFFETNKLITFNRFLLFVSLTNERKLF